MGWMNSNELEIDFYVYNINENKMDEFVLDYVTLGFVKE